MLKTWFNKNDKNPYPSKEVKDELAFKAGLKVKQVRKFPLPVSFTATTIFMKLERVLQKKKKTPTTLNNECIRRLIRGLLMPEESLEGKDRKTAKRKSLCSGQQGGKLFRVSVYRKIAGPDLFQHIKDYVPCTCGHPLILKMGRFHRNDRIGLQLEESVLRDFMQIA